MGVDIAKAVFAAGNAVFAAGRSTDAVQVAVRRNDDLLVVEFDGTDPADAKMTARAGA